MKNINTESIQNLRQQAYDKVLEEEILEALPSLEQFPQILNELRVHQIELEMQNKELLRTQFELEDSRARYIDLYDMAPSGYLTIDEQGLIKNANFAASTLLGPSRGALINQPVSRFILPADQDIFYLQRKKLFTTNSPQGWDMRMLHTDGSSFWAHLQANPVENGECRITFNDNPERMRTEEALKTSLSLLNATLESTADGIIVVDLRGSINRWNHKFVDMWQVPEELMKTQDKSMMLDHVVSQIAHPEEFIDKLVELYKNPEESSSEILFLANGLIYSWYSQPQRIDADVIGRVWSFRDITDHMRAEKALEESNHKLEIMSITDGLTGIANRRRFDQVLALEHARHERTKTELSLIMLDIDHFKEFNDCYGHILGDQCLQLIARVIDDNANRPADLAARYGGEEFACILPETDLDGAVAIAEKIRCGIIDLAIPHHKSTVADCVTASFGVATFKCATEGSAADIVVKADSLLYQAKSCGRNCLIF